MSEQLVLALDPVDQADPLADLDLEHAARVLAEEEATAAPRACRCPSPLVFRPLPGDGATCSLCGRAAAT